MTSPELGHGIDSAKNILEKGQTQIEARLKMPQIQANLTSSLAETGVARRVNVDASKFTKWLEEQKIKGVQFSPDIQEFVLGKRQESTTPSPQTPTQKAETADKKIPPSTEKITSSPVVTENPEQKAKEAKYNKIAVRFKVDKPEDLASDHSYDKLSGWRNDIVMGAPNLKNNPEAQKLLQKIDAALDILDAQKKSPQKKEKVEKNSTQVEQKNGNPILLETQSIAEKTGTTLISAKDRSDLVKIMYPMALIDGDFDKSKASSVESAIQSYGKRVGGANYSMDIVIKAANSPNNQTAEFKKFIDSLVVQGKITKNPQGLFENKNPKSGGVILTIPDGDPTFALHEARHAEAAFHNLRNNPELLNKIESTIQQQSPEWKKTAFSFFLNTPYWKFESPAGFSTPTEKLSQTDKQAKVQEYLTKSQGAILFPKNPEDRAWILDEFLAYTTDKNNSTIPDIPALSNIFEKSSK